MTSALDTFIEISQWKDSRESAQAYLDAANGNVEMALMSSYDGPDAAVPPRLGPDSTTSQSGSSTGTLRRPTKPEPPVQSSMEELNAEYKRDLVKAVAPRVSPTLVYYSLRLPSSISGLSSVVDKIVGLFTQLSPKPAQSSSEASLAGRLSFFTDHISPISAAQGENSKSIPRISSTTKSYNEALELVKSELKFLLVVIVSGVHESSLHEHSKSVLDSEAAQRDDVYIWIRSALTAEGFGVANAFNASGLPLTTLVGASPKSAHSSVIVMERLVQDCRPWTSRTPESPVAFSKSVATAIENQEPKSLSLRLNRQQSSVDREIREQQDSAYERSLRADREKAERARKQQEADASAAKKHQAWSSRVANRAQIYTDSASSAAKDTARISSRLPSGRLDLRFPGDAPISDIFDVVYSHLHKDESPTSGDTISGVDSEDYAPYEFTLTSTISRKRLELSPQSVRESGESWPSGVLMVDLD